MDPNQPDDGGFDTRAVRAGQRRTPEGEHNDPIFTTSSFVFSSAAEAAGRFQDTEPGNVYSRFTNPTVRAFEQRLASLEGAQACVATASGMSAILTLCLAMLGTGDHVVAGRSLFGATVNLFRGVLSRFGVTVSFVPLGDPQQWEDAITPRTRLLFLETPSNPLMEIADIAALAEIAARHGRPLAVDNAFCTPALQRPLDLGADIVVHSATKYLDGQGRCVGGAVAVRDPQLHDKLFAVLRTSGASMSPFNAWVFLKGLETLRLRMRAHSEAALELAHWLSGQPAVTRVYHPGLPSHPGHELAARQQSGFGGIVSFEVDGGREAAWHVVDSVQMLSITGNLGDAKSTITHPASTTHGRLDPADREAAGINESLLRVSVGLEDPADIRADLARGLLSLKRRPRRHAVI